LQRDQASSARTSVAEQSGVELQRWRSGRQGIGSHHHEGLAVVRPSSRNYSLPGVGTAEAGGIRSHTDTDLGPSEVVVEEDLTESDAEIGGVGGPKPAQGHVFVEYTIVRLLHPALDEGPLGDGNEAHARGWRKLGRDDLDPAPHRPERHVVD